MHYFGSNQQLSTWASDLLNMLKVIPGTGNLTNIQDYWSHKYWRWNYNHHFTKTEYLNYILNICPYVYR